MYNVKIKLLIVYMKKKQSGSAKLEETEGTKTAAAGAGVKRPVVNAYVCGSCRSALNPDRCSACKWKCPKCDDFDICSKCKNKTTT